MDKANIEQQRALAKRILEVADADAGEHQPNAMLEIETHAEELAELVLAQTSRAQIVLYIDPDAYRQESESGELTEEMLNEYGRQVNEDAAPIFGYEGWETHMPTETATESEG